MSIYLQEYIQYPVHYNYNKVIVACTCRKPGIINTVGMVNLFGWQIFRFLTTILKPNKKSVGIQMEMAKMVAILFLPFEYRIAKTFCTYLNVFFIGCSVLEPPLYLDLELAVLTTRHKIWISYKN